MIEVDIIGFIKVADDDSARINHLLACIRSYSFLKERATLIICLESPGFRLYDMVDRELKKSMLYYALFQSSASDSYGKTYWNLLKCCKSNYVINFMEDQFMLPDDPNVISGVIETMKQHRVDICKASFFQIEQNSSKELFPIDDSPFGKIFLNDRGNFSRYQNHYGRRYYIGVNCITTKEFAEKIWGRPINDSRPHSYEIPDFDENFLHICMIPKMELQCAVLDDHGEPGTALVNRKQEKFRQIMGDITFENQPLRSEPWLTEAANVILAEYFKKNDKIKVLEFGMGASTLWFLRQPQLEFLYSVDHDQSWFDRINSEAFPLTDSPLKYECHLLPRPYASVVCERFKDDYFDLIFIDGRDRVRCIESAIPKLKSDGCLILDNSEREEYAPGIELLKGWFQTDTLQEMPDKYNFTYPNWKTSFFIKP